MQVRELDLTDDEVIAFADLHAGVLQPSPRRINPYFLGYKILEDIERRFSDDGKDLDAAREKLFEVREIENDASLLRNYLTRELCDDLDLYVYGQQGDDVVVTDKDWENVRDMLVDELTAHGKPLIVADDGDYRGNRELYLRHSWEGRDLDLNYAEHVLEYVGNLWGRTVHLEMNNGGNQAVLSWDAEEGIAAKRDRARIAPRRGGSRTAPYISRACRAACHIDIERRGAARPRFPRECALMDEHAEAVHGAQSACLRGAQQRRRAVDEVVDRPHSAGDASRGQRESAVSSPCRPTEVALTSSAASGSIAARPHRCLMPVTVRLAGYCC